MPGRTRVLFVCQHGAAKSVMAAAELQLLAEAHGLTLECASAGLEPDLQVPPEVVAGLGARGIDVSTLQPARVTRAMLAEADHVVSFGCELATLGRETRSVVRWDDVPAMSADYASAREAIVARVGVLFSELTAAARRDVDG